MFYNELCSLIAFFLVYAMHILFTFVTIVLSLCLLLLLTYYASIICWSLSFTRLLFWVMWKAEMVIPGLVKDLATRESVVQRIVGQLISVWFLLHISTQSCNLMSGL